MPVDDLKKMLIYFISKCIESGKGIGDLCRRSMLGYRAAFNGDRPDPVGRVNQVLNQKPAWIVFRHCPDESGFAMAMPWCPEGGAFFDDLRLRIDQSWAPSFRPLSLLEGPE